MPIDPKQAKARTFPALSVDVERGQLQFFAKATASTNAVYSDVEAAKRAGYRDLPVPPTFFFSLELQSADTFGYLAELGADLRRILHGEQEFTYHQLAYAGDTLSLQPRIVDVFSRRGGALQFLVKQTSITRGDEPIAEAKTVIVVRSQEVIDS